MTPERFRQIRNLFEAALDRDSDARIAFLEEATQGDPSLREEVQHLLAAHQQGTGLLEQSARPELFAGEVDRIEERRMEGRRMDHYEILRELGHGGMGTVYLATRTDGVYRKPVALKVVRPEAGSREIIERFRQERQILAALDHPNIARLLDGGRTPEGLPYLVMEYIEGKPIDLYCDERKLSVAERLALFRTVCDAVECAHRHAVAHRDLKPGNILVTADATAKLLDFGVAKLLRTDASEITAAYVTRTGMHLMTPEYASPEQLRGEPVGAASDIYSLGAILYELLSGHRPYRLSSRLIHEVVRAISEEDPKPPSTAISKTEQSIPRDGGKPVTITPESVSQARGTTPAQLRRELSGDLDRIALKALRKEPEKRYGTAEALGEDVRRHVEGLPVAARGGSVLYPIGKLLRRTFGVAAAALVLATWTYKGVQGWPLLFLVTVVVTYHLLTQRTTRDSRSWFRLQTALLGEATLFGTSWAVLGTRFSVNVRIVQVWDLLLLLSGIWMAASLARWPLRNWWAGPVLLDISRPAWSARIDRISYWVMYLLIFWFGRYLNLAEVIWMCLLCARLFPSPRAEMRQYGILRFGSGLIRWRNIEAFDWREYRYQSSAPGLFAFGQDRSFSLPSIVPQDRWPWTRAEGSLMALKLTLRQRFHILRGLQSWLWDRVILVPAGRKAAAEAILRKQLGSGGEGPPS